MGKLTKEQADQLKELQALAEAPEAEDYDIEIGSGDNFARVPYSKGRAWLQKTFGIDLDPDPEPEAEDKGKEKGAKAKDSGGEVRPVRFGRRVS